MFSLNEKIEVNQILLKTVGFSHRYGLETFATTEAQACKRVQEAVQRESMDDSDIPAVEKTVPTFMKVTKKDYVRWLTTYFTQLTHLTHLYRLDINFG